jgi:hypothetical protein
MMRTVGAGEIAQNELARNRLDEAVWRLRLLSADEILMADGEEKCHEDLLLWETRHEIFAIKLRDNKVGYPAFQLQRQTGKPWPTVASVLPRLHKEMTADDILIWFDSPHPALEHRKPLEFVHDDNSLKRAVDYSCVDKKNALSHW